MTTSVRLHQLSEYPLHPDHVAHLWEMKRQGFEPRVIYDVGACVLQWTKVARRVWPDARIVLFDACEAVEPMYRSSPYTYHIGVLSDPAKTSVVFYQDDDNPHGNSYYRETSGHFPESTGVSKPARTLDDVAASLGLPPPDLIKIDVQGSELDVLAGGTRALRHAQRLIVELQHVEYNRGAPLSSESVPAIERLGFRCVAPVFADNGADADYEFRRI